MKNKHFTWRAEDMVQQLKATASLQELGSVSSTYMEDHNLISGHLVLSSSLWRYLHIYGAQTYTKVHIHNKSMRTACKACSTQWVLDEWVSATYQDLKSWNKEQLKIKYFKRKDFFGIINYYIA